MPTITSLGIGSGLDLENMIAELIAVEKAPRENILNLKEAAITGEITGVGTLKSVLATFETGLVSYDSTTDFNTRTATSADTSVYTVSADSTAVSGTYAVEVQQLAVAEKLISSGFTDTSTVVGTGSLTIAKADASESFTLTITSSNDTLAEIRDEINNASDNFGVTATIVTVDNGGGGTESKLILTSDEVGADNQLRVTTDDDDSNDTDTNGLSQLVYDSPSTTNMTELQAATNAIIEVDSQTITSTSSNIFADVITGVTITAVKEDIGNTHDLNVTLSHSSVTSKVNSFINDFNSMMSIMNALSSYNEDSGGASGLLFGDPALRSIKNAVLRTVTSEVSGLTGTYTSLSQIGVRLDENNQLSLDSTELSDALNDEFDDIGEIFASTNGLAASLKTIINEYTLSSTGVLDKKTSSLNTIIDGIAQDREDLDRFSIKREELLRVQFTAMDSLLGQLQATGSFLTQQFDILADFYKKE